MKLLTIFIIALFLTACGSDQSNSNLSDSHASASKSLTCTFINQAKNNRYVISGRVSPAGVLHVTHVTGGVQKEIEGKEINNNPIRSKVGLTGESEFYIDALADDPDFGDTFTLKFPKKLQVGSQTASMAHVYYSRNPIPYANVSGNCIIR